MGHEVVLAGERARLSNRADWTPKKIEFLYELAFLRLFSSWETVLESIFLRSLCGFASRSGRETLGVGSYYRSLALAETAVLQSESRGNHVRTYMLWHSASVIISRCQKHINPRGVGICGIQEGVIASNQSRLDAWAAVRHRIVHEQSDAKARFDNASRMFSGRSYPNSRPGKFLMAIDTNSTPQRKWLETAIAELTGLAGQMV